MKHEFQIPPTGNGKPLEGGQQSPDRAPGHPCSKDHAEKNGHILFEIEIFRIFAGNPVTGIQKMHGQVLNDAGNRCFAQQIRITQNGAKGFCRDAYLSDFDLSKRASHTAGII